MDSSEEIAVNGGNHFLAGAFAIVGIYETGQAFGGYIAQTVNQSFGMTTGLAAYRTVRQCRGWLV
ncbi:MAG: hypothetical protein ACI8Z1_003478 [Candidatus Azotimanducaceae bacterium]